MKKIPEAIAMYHSIRPEDREKPFSISLIYGPEDREEVIGYFKTANEARKVYKHNLEKYSKKEGW